MGMADDDGTASHLLAVERLDCICALLFATHDNEGKPAGAAGMTVENNFRRNHLPVLLKQKLEILVGL